jgi:tetratricopeptide (TPR) repeat protein
MHHRIAIPLFALLGMATPAAAQTLADGKICDRAVGGSAPDRATIQRMMTSNPASPIAQFAAGCTDVMNSKWDSAAVHFDAAARGNPRSSVAFLWVGNIAGQLARLGNAQSKARLAPVARDAYAKAVTLDGHNIDAREGLMNFLLEAPASLGGDKTKAAEQATAIGTVNPFRGLSAHITVATASNDRAGVEQFLLQASTQFPDSVLGWANLSAMQADDKRPADAFATIARWQARKSNAMFALFSLGRTAAVTGAQMDRGILALQQFLKGQRGPNDPPYANAHYRLGQIYEKQSRKAEAKSEYTTAVNLNPMLRDAQFALERVK